MYQFRVSKVAPFWARNNENKPNQTIFTNWLNDNMEEVTNLPIHFVNFTTFTLNGAYNDIKYIEITNTKDTNDIRYYYVDTIEMDAGNNTYKYRGVIDVYTTYTLKFINDNINNEFVFMRQHNYDKRCLQIRDSYLDELPKIYTSYYFKKTLFNKDETNNIWYGNEIGIKDNNDLINANKYYVFKDGPNGGYTFYPILSNSLNVELLYKQRVKGTLKSDLNYWNGRAAREERIEISDEVNNSVVNGYKNNEWVEFLYRPMKNNGLTFEDWKVINNVPYGTLPIDIKANSNQWNEAGAGIKQASFDIYLLGNNVYHYRSGNCLVWDHTPQWNKCKEFRQLKVRVYNSTTKWTTKTINNSLTGLEILRKQEGNINKFLGIYYLPHFLNFDAQRLNFKDDYVYLNINPQIDNIGLFKIYEYQLSNITDKLNNSSYSTEYFLRYLNIKYYGNNINAEYRTNEQHNIYIGGRLFFTDTANIICKSNEYVSLDNSIISYPYQLPIGVDTYEQYVKSNRNITETGFNIARKQQELAFAKSIIGGITGAGTALTKAAMGDYVGAAKGAIDTTIGLGFDIAGQFQGLANQEAQIRAQYEQANNTMGNAMQYSNIETAALMEYYNDETGEQYEGVEVSELEKNVLILMNNYIYLNGYMLPNNDTFNNKINNNRTFNYIQLDATLLQNQLNIKYDDSKYNNAIYQMIKEQLLNGIRIWNNINDKLPEFDDNEEWPNQPDYERPEIPQPTPPQLPDTNYQITINAFSPTSIITNTCPSCSSWGFFGLYYNNDDAYNKHPIFTINPYDQKLLANNLDEAVYKGSEVNNITLNINIDFTNISFNNTNLNYMDRMFRVDNFFDSRKIKKIVMKITNCPYDYLKNMSNFVKSGIYSTFKFEYWYNGELIYDNDWVFEV